MREKPYNNLNPAELERLALLSEELGEAQQVIGKILRHGYSEGHPERLTTNRRDLEKEIGHILLALELMRENDDLSNREIQESRIEKRRKIGEYLHHQEAE